MLRRHRTDARDGLGAPRRQATSIHELVRGFASAQTMIRNFDGRIRYWSRGAERLYGFTRPEALGALASTLLATEYPQPLVQIENTLASAGRWQGELLRRHRNGRPLHVASHWVLTRRTKGGPSVVEVANDITERAEAEQTRLYYAAIVENSNDAIISKDLNGIVTSWNPAAEAIFGWRAHEIIGRSIAVILPPAGRDQEEAILSRLRAGELLTHMEAVRRHRDGHDVLVSLTISPIRDQDGDIIGASKIARDITPLRRSEEAFQRTRRLQAIGHLTGGTVHDFNNLLGIILGNIEELQTLLPPTAEAADLANEILLAATNGAALTDRLLAFARGHVPSPEAIDLTAHLPQYIALVRRAIGRTVRTIVTLTPEPWPVRVAPAQLGDALLNLAINARDAMAENAGTLTIETANVRLFRDGMGLDANPAGGAYVMLAVTDNGAGIPPHMLDRVAEPFFTTKPAGEGSGLGLSMVRGLALQSGGLLVVESAVESGTTVRIYLPHADTPADMLACNAAPAAWPRGRETILVVGENPHQRAMTACHLAKLGYRPRSVADGAAALALLAGNARVDLILADLGAADSDATHPFIAAARRDRPALRVVLTADRPPPDSSVLSCPYTTFLQQPYGWEDLSHRLRLSLDSTAAG